MDVAVIGNLPHYIIDNELTISIFLAPNQAERLDHECPFLIGWGLAMLPQHCHWGIARIAVEQRELKRQREARVPRGIFLQLAQIAFGHNRKALAIRHDFGKITGYDVLQSACLWTHRRKPEQGRPDPVAVRAISQAHFSESVPAANS